MVPKALPNAISEIRYLDPTHNVLICKHNGSRKGITPSALSDHFNSASIELRDRFENYAAQFRVQTIMIILELPLKCALFFTILIF